MASPATVRPATLDDVEFLSQVVYAAVYLPENPDAPATDQEHWIEDYRAGTRDQVLGRVTDSLTYVVLYGNERVGRLRVVRTADRVFIGGIQILPDYQGRGIGTAVLTTLLDEAGTKGLPVELRVDRRNQEAERLYTRLGSRRTGEDGDDYHMTATVNQP